jgi:hypothetical protein
MTAADKRIEELLARWQTSLELHARYVQLDDAAYARVERWPQHQRPTAWIIDLARKRLAELREHLTRRQAGGDTSFAEALELMSFLTSLLGSEHLERFIPLATGKPPVDTGASATVQQPKLRAAKPRQTSAHTGSHRQPGASKPVPTQKPAATQRATTRAVPRAPAPAPASASAVPDARAQQVIADAIRILGWGREWPELGGLIARMADRPSEAEVWKILRAHRAEIMARAGRPAS